MKGYLYSLGGSPPVGRVGILVMGERAGILDHTHSFDSRAGGVMYLILELAPVPNKFLLWTRESLR